MNNETECNMVECCVDVSLGNEFINPTGQRPYTHEIYEDEAFIITTYFTNFWLHAHEHVEAIIPGTFPSRSYAGKKVGIPLGHYEITLQFNSLEIDKDNNWYTDQWISNVTDTITNDKLELVIEGEYDYNPGHACSEISESLATALVKAIVTQCENDLGYKLMDARQLRDDVGDKLSELYNDTNIPQYPEWFIRNLWPTFCDL